MFSGLLDKNCNSLASAILLVRPPMIECYSIKVFASLHQIVFSFSSRSVKGWTLCLFLLKEEIEAVVGVVENCQKRPSGALCPRKEPQSDRAFSSSIIHSCTLV